MKVRSWLSRVLRPYERMLVAAEGYPDGLVWDALGRDLIDTLPNAPGVVIARRADAPPSLAAGPDLARLGSDLLAQPQGIVEVAIIRTVTAKQAAQLRERLRDSFGLAAAPGDAAGGWRR